MTALCTAACLAAGGATLPAGATDDLRSTTAEQMGLVPAPASIELTPGTFTIQPDLRVVAAPGEVERIARYFSELTLRTTGVPLQVATHASSPRGQIAFVLDPDSIVDPEGYVLQVSEPAITVSASDARGLFYGAVTLWQMLTARAPPDGNGRSPGARHDPVALPALRIVDEPRFIWRGFMLDVARHYRPPAEIKQLLDWMALHKLNTFHWHLTDDQGWRLEIRKYPRLTQVGAWRVPAGAAYEKDIDPQTGQPRRYGGYYTQEEVRDIVRYAAERFIAVVPEIEMPGHAHAAITAYPRLGTGETPQAVSADWGVHDHLFNVEEGTFAFLEDVLAEVIELFPGELVHIGGDEAVKDRWRASPRVQQRMRELGIQGEAQLQSYFVSRIERYLASHGRRLIGWDEILDGGLPPRATVMSWRGTAGAVEAARQGHDVVLSPAPQLYLDYLQSQSPHEPPGRPSYVTLADVYAFRPIPEEIGPLEARHVLGAQLNAWTEHMRTPERVQHNAFPRMAALAEVLWTPPARHDWNSFLRRLVIQFGRYERLGVHYADSAFEVQLVGLQPLSQGSALVSLTKQVEPGEIRYTVDGSEPTAQAQRYTAPIPVALATTVRAAAFVDGRRVSEPRTFEVDQAALLRRTDEALASCEHRLLLRLEDDAPLHGERAIFNVDIMNPCWIYRDADLTRVTRIAAAVGQLPFNFRIGADVEQIPIRKPATSAGELEVRLHRCDGRRIAILPLAPAVSNDAVTPLPAAQVAPHAGRHDLCFRFNTGAIDPMWVVDSVQLIERAE